jgi:hypothetical protein
MLAVECFNTCKERAKEATKGMIRARIMLLSETLDYYTYDERQQESRMREIRTSGLTRGNDGAGLHPPVDSYSTARARARVNKIGSKVLYKDFLMGYIGGNSSNCQRIMAFSSKHRLRNEYEKDRRMCSQLF